MGRRAGKQRASRLLHFLVAKLPLGNAIYREAPASPTPIPKFSGSQVVIRNPISAPNSAGPPFYGRWNVGQESTRRAAKPKRPTPFSSLSSLAASRYPLPIKFRNIFSLVMWEVKSTHPQLSPRYLARSDHCAWPCNSSFRPKTKKLPLFKTNVA